MKKKKSEYINDLKHKLNTDITIKPIKYVKYSKSNLTQKQVPTQLFQLKYNMRQFCDQSFNAFSAANFNIIILHTFCY